MIAIGDIVRLTPELQNRLQGHVGDVCGEVLAIGKLTARVAWDDGREHSSLLSSLVPAAPPASTYNRDHIDALLEQRAVILTVAHAELHRAWGQTKTELGS